MDFYCPKCGSGSCNYYCKEVPMNPDARDKLAENMKIDMKCKHDLIFNECLSCRQNFVIELDHPCKQTCSGWKQGYEAALKACQTNPELISVEIAKAKAEVWEEAGDLVNVMHTSEPGLFPRFEDEEQWKGANHFKVHLANYLWKKSEEECSINNETSTV